MVTDKKFPVYPGWETVRLIGRGSFGAVYEIQRDVFGKLEKAALKHVSIPQNQSDVEELYSTGYDEASITAHYESYLADIVKEYQLMLDMKGHTNVVNCDDIRYIQKDEGIGWDIYFKMELLTPMMKALDHAATEEQIVKLGKDITNALILCRKRNIIHRDIKPQNIFLSNDGDFKLGDFGIAKTAEKTTGGTKIGTYNYMAPEVYNNQPYGHETDIYSLGMVLYWLLNDRRLPFYPAPPAVPKSSDMDKARLRRFRGETIPAPAHGSPELQRIVLKACAFDPKDRYRSAEELLQDLNALGNGAVKPEAHRQEPGKQEPFKTPDRPEEKGGETDETVGANVRGCAVSPSGGGVLLGSLSKAGSARSGEKKEIERSAFPDAEDGENTLGRPETPADPADEPDLEKTVGVFKDRTKRDRHGSAGETGDRSLPIDEASAPEDEDKTVGIFAPRTQQTEEKAEASKQAPEKTEKTEDTAASPAPQQNKKSKKKKIITGVIIGFAALLALAAIGFFTIHSWNPASCTEPETCSICGRTRGEALGHDWKAATCTEPETCTVCGATRGSARGHDWKAATCTEPETCTVCGTTRGTVADHDWAPATCTEPAICRNCGATQGTALDHDWKAATCTEPETCRRCGATRGSALGHDWKEATCTEPETCRRCGETRGSPQHDWAPATYDKPQTCRRCGATTGHVKGYVGELKYSIGERVRLHGRTSTNAFELEKPVKNCMAITVRVKFFNVSGNPYGDWYFFGRDLNGKWQNIGQFHVGKECESDYCEYTVQLKGRPSFDAIVVSPIYDSNDGWSLSWDISFIDVQEYVD